MSPRPRLVRVAVPVPLADAFDYLAADGPLPQIGCRVRVPFGRRERIGLVVEHPATTDVARERLRTIGAVLDPAPSIGSERSEERRVGKECRSRWWPYHQK